jgi:hypothetical protein
MYARVYPPSLSDIYEVKYSAARRALPHDDAAAAKWACPPLRRRFRPRADGWTRLRRGQDGHVVGPRVGFLVALFSGSTVSLISRIRVTNAIVNVVAHSTGIGLIRCK